MAKIAHCNKKWTNTIYRLSNRMVLFSNDCRLVALVCPRKGKRQFESRPSSVQRLKLASTAPTFAL